MERLKKIRVVGKHHAYLSVRRPSSRLCGGGGAPPPLGGRLAHVGTRFLGVGLDAFLGHVSDPHASTWIPAGHVYVYCCARTHMLTRGYPHAPIVRVSGCISVQYSRLYSWHRWYRPVVHGYISVRYSRLGVKTEVGRAVRWTRSDWYRLVYTGIYWV